MLARSNEKNNARPPGHLMLIYVFYKLLLILGDYILLGRFKLRNEVLDDLGIYADFTGCIYDGELILYDTHEC